MSSSLPLDSGAGPPRSPDPTPRGHPSQSPTRSHRLLQAAEILTQQEPGSLPVSTLELPSGIVVNDLCPSPKKKLRSRTGNSQAVPCEDEAAAAAADLTRIYRKASGGSVLLSVEDPQAQHAASASKTHEASVVSPSRNSRSSSNCDGVSHQYFNTPLPRSQVVQSRSKSSGLKLDPPTINVDDRSAFIVEVARGKLKAKAKRRIKFTVLDLDDTLIATTANRLHEPSVPGALETAAEFYATVIKSAEPGNVFLVTQSTREGVLCSAQNLPQNLIDSTLRLRERALRTRARG